MSSSISDDNKNISLKTLKKTKGKNVERKQNFEENVRKSRLRQSRVQRRNTMDCAILNKIFVDEETKRSEKKAQDLLREAKQDLKNSTSKLTKPENIPETSTINNRSNVALTLVKSCSRFMSVSSRPVGCRSSAPPAAFVNPNTKVDFFESEKLQSRKEFHEMFGNLIKLGSIDKQDGKLSHEDYTFQTELKDLIWLELQAWHADRTLEQQDKFLYKARESVPTLLNEILNYRFNPNFQREASIVSYDSGLGTDSSEKICDTDSRECKGCFSTYCKDCNELQVYALKEVEELLVRLENAECLYPSSQAMSAFHPIYKSPEFIGQVKAMCLWYNITKQHRLKMIILGKLLIRLQGGTFDWPLQSSVIENKTPTMDSKDDLPLGNLKKSGSKIIFKIDSNTELCDPNDSNNSNDSELRDFSDQALSPSIHEYEEINIFNVNFKTYNNLESISQSNRLYRKYIENVLKTKGLGKSLAFLHRLQNIVLQKAQVALEKPGIDECDSDEELFEEESSRIELIDPEQADELRRYGYWSKEAKSLNLPSFISSFIFLSLIPLEVIHEFLRMRLETRPHKPNPLSLEQLMKELREGLTLALTHRERCIRHITTALAEHENEYTKYISTLEEFNCTVKKVLELYLEYVDQWVIVAISYQKSALEKEWMFTKLVSPMIPGTHAIATEKFCSIIQKFLKSIADRLIKSVHNLNKKIDEPQHKDAKKLHLLQVCRETQSMLTGERESSLKLLYFTKSFCCDVEKKDFHREHYEDYLNKAHTNVVACPNLKKQFRILIKDILDVRNKLTNIIEGIQNKCNVENLLDLDELDRLAVLSRSKEILHQCYKFGFEYNKDLIKLFQQEIIAYKDEESILDLSLGIITFAKMWMQFVTERCERGRGVRPRWASQGLEFLILACDPYNTKHLSEFEFDCLKKKMDACISHVIGIVTEPEKSKKRASPRTRKSSSPNPYRSRTPTRTFMAGMQTNCSSKFLQPQFSLNEPLIEKKGLDSPDSVNDSLSNVFMTVPSINSPFCSLALRHVRVRDAVNNLDLKLDNKLKEQKLIGKVKNILGGKKINMAAKSVNFRWHRGIKIGQGRFGKVYTAVNNTIGDLIAMKEIQIQPGETGAINKVAEELKILEGISHKHLVKYYGVEIHREELLIFMELCSEGTLEALVELSGGLHEGLVRRFTAQLLSGVAELHNNGIVHRDIKTANIFLVDHGNSLKLGDFGSAVKIQAHTTVPGELRGYVGTQAYMAPEVFTKTNSDGHGRAADIWSVGCVVVEMSSGKRPWYQFDSNFQIMFKVGMGESPEIPETLSQEGHEFLEICLQHDPKMRLPAAELLQHNFCKVELEEDIKLER